MKIEIYTDKLRKGIRIECADVILIGTGSVI